MTHKRDPFAAVSRDELIALDDDALPALVAATEARAEATGRSVAEAASALPVAWRNIVRAALALEGIVDSDSFAGACLFVTRTHEMRALSDFFRSLDEPSCQIVADALAEALPYARALNDGVDPGEIEELAELLHPDDINIIAIRNALKKAVVAVALPFPAAR